ncbi:DUF1573 domain-containing protein [Arsenicibacter rosenii]|uniref:DUF1573 domain-containing protein n=1 Tax=Arsenicibacter rosenii TaxID=1750698 RepID=A0A1S2VD63_9BACT|nr:DUF1573 domain-containing protein [Arsenicibacter rosenii]OIN56691.1 hypothetical protein BLX24_23170 [Arsenicibacter rosenii]
MKRTILFSFGLMLMAATLVLANTNFMAAFGWTSTSHDFGKIAQNKPVTAVFKFTNKGEAPLIISNARGSCGCTGVDYPKDPVMPGKTGEVKATYNAAAMGAFSKTVTVESNAEGGMVTLMFKGEVVNNATGTSGN